MVTVDRQYAGAAAATIINTAMTPTTPGVGGTITVADDSGYPSSGKFEIVVDRGEPNEESVLISSRSGTTFTIGQRGYDGTVASSHTSGQATCAAELAGRSVQLFVDHVDDMESDPHSTKLLNNTRHDITARHQFGAALGTPAAPTTIVPDAAGNAGAAAGPARADHTHAISAIVPVDIGTANAEGGDASFARGQHVHKIGTGAINASAMFAADVVDSAAIAANAVGSSEIAADAVGASELANNAVDTGAILDNAVTDAKIEDNFLRGIIAQQVLTADEGAAHSASGATDMLLNNVPVVSGHTYAIHLHSAWQLTPGGSFCEWNINLHINGALADHFGKATQYVTQNGFGAIDGTCYWVAPATQSTDDFTVEVVEFSGSFTFILKGAATSRRTLTISDLGVL